VAITVDVANLGTATQTAAGTTMAFTTTAAVASGARIIVTGGCWDVIATVSSVAGGGLTWTIDKQGHDLIVVNPNPYIVSANAPSGLASGTTITVTFNLEADVAGTIGGSSFLGIDTTTPVEEAGGPVGVSPAATAWASPSMTIDAGALLIATCWNETNSSASTPSAGSTEALDFSNADGYGQTTAYRIEASAGTYTVAGTWGTAAQSTTNAVAYKAAASATSLLIPRRAHRGLVMR
jgi:hypothetical protein